MASWIVDHGPRIMDHITAAQGITVCPSRTASEIRQLINNL
jgi:hypothetical protein